MNIILHKWNKVRTGEWGWSIGEVWNEQDCIYSDPYYVVIPDNFFLAETVSGENLYFRRGCKIAYEVCCSSDYKNCQPLLVGGDPVEIVKLKVIGKVK